MERVAIGPPAYIISFGESTRLPSLQGSTRHFISREAYDEWVSKHNAHKAHHERKTTVPPSPASSSLLANIPPRQTTSRSNIIDYLSYQCGDARLEAAVVIEAELRWREQAQGNATGSESRMEIEFPTEDLRKAELDSRRAEGLSSLIHSMMKTEKGGSRVIKMVERRHSLSFGLPAQPEKETGCPKELQKRLPKQTTRRIALNDLIDAILGFGSQILPSGPSHSISLTKLLRRSDPAPSLHLLGIISSKTYQSSMTSINTSGRPTTDNSFTKGLIAQKFRKSDSSSTPTAAAESSTRSTISHPLFGATSTPHMDYRIVQTQNARSRARIVFGPGVKGAWCSLHRIENCEGCFGEGKTGMGKMVSVLDRRYMNLPAQGIAPSGTMGRKKALVDAVADFIVFSADVLMESRRGTSGNGKGGEKEDGLWENWENEILKSGSMTRSTSNDTIPTLGSSPKGKEKEMPEPIPIELHLRWYNLLASFLIAACLEGYLVHGWKGVDAVECLFGVGCGGWEGRGWASRLPSMENLQREGEMDSEDEESETGEEERRKEEDEKSKETFVFITKLHNAARLLFGNMNQNQSEFERMMRDRTHEFLNIPTEDTLESHLRNLSSKYPLSRFISEVREFLLASRNFLGVPQLAQNEEAGKTVTPAGGPSKIISSVMALSAFMDRIDPDQEIVTNKEWEHEKMSSNNKRPRQPSLNDEDRPSGSTKRRIEDVEG
ncbi:hypothetical protein BT69DRAFT_1300213 [Atractiella rhizophila]|nr:hypothetical protein BT69DRAFT_1300213 [Atractiella rhizophila]